MISPMVEPEQHTKPTNSHRTMKRILVLAICICGSLCFYSCHQSDKKSGKTTFGKKQKEIIALYNMADSIYYKEGRIDTTAFIRFIDKAVAFASEYPKDEISPEMLYRAGIGSMILAKAAKDRPQTAKYAKKALAVFNQFQEQYPKHENAKYCYYQRGIIYDDILGDSNSAEDQYRDFVNRYPDDPLSAQLSEYIKMLGKSDKEIEELLHLD